MFSKIVVNIYWFTRAWLGNDGAPALQWRPNGRDSVSNHQPHHRLLNIKTSKLRVTGLCAGNSPETGEFPAQMASNAENVSIWWRHHGVTIRWSLQMGTLFNVVFFSNDLTIVISIRSEISFALIRFLLIRSCPLFKRVWYSSCTGFQYFVAIILLKFGWKQITIPTGLIIGCVDQGDDNKWKHFPRYGPFVRGIQRSSVYSPHKGQQRGALMFSLICARKKRLSKHQPHDCLLNRLFRRKSKKTSKLRVTCLCEGRNSPTTGELSARMASNAENVSSAEITCGSLEKALQK